MAALLAAFAAFIVVGRLVPSERAPVAVAARDLAGGVVLTAEDVTTRLVPVDLVDAAARSPTELVGRRLATGMSSGELLTVSRLVPRIGDGRLPVGTVPVHVRSSDPASLDLVSAGDRVAVHPLVAAKEAVAGAALVLSVDPTASASVLGSGSPSVRGAVLALTPAQVTRLLQSAPDPLAPIGAHLVLVPATS